jgi:hypothetical protein
MVSRHEQHAALRPEPLADRPHHGLGDRERLPLPALHQLDRVPEQHQPVNPVERVEQPAPGLGMAQHVVAEPGAEV